MSSVRDETNFIRNFMKSSPLSCYKATQTCTVSWQSQRIYFSIYYIILQSLVRAKLHTYKFPVVTTEDVAA